MWCRDSKTCRCPGELAQALGGTMTGGRRGQTQEGGPDAGDKAYTEAPQGYAALARP